MINKSNINKNKKRNKRMAAPAESWSNVTADGPVPGGGEEGLRWYYVMFHMRNLLGWLRLGWLKIP